MPSKTNLDMTPPQGVRRAFARGLELKDEYGGKGLVAETVRWARKLSHGDAVTAQKVRKMHGWFARHKVDKRPGWARPPTAGYVAWLLWGGDPGMRWVNKLTRQIDKKK